MSAEPNISEIIGTQARKNHSSGLNAPSPARGMLGHIKTEINPQFFDSDRKELCWITANNKYWAANRAPKGLENACYRCYSSDNVGFYVEKHDVITDDLVTLPGNVIPDVIREFNTFWEVKNQFISRGFLHKRGILLWGPPGGGKTSALYLLCQIIINELNGVVVFVDEPKNAIGCLKMLRQVEPDRRVIVILEDLDGLVETYGESEYLSLLDGEAQIDNVVNLATTNYPERLDKRFIERPSRFDVVKWVGMPTDDMRSYYLRKKEPSLTPKELESWVYLTKGFSIAHLKELIISVKCLGHTVEETIVNFNRLKLRTPNSANSPDKTQVGFHNE